MASQRWKSSMNLQEFVWEIKKTSFFKLKFIKKEQLEEYRQLWKLKMGMNAEQDVI